MSKGSKPRPIPDRDAFERNWERIFGKKVKKPPEPQKKLT